MVQYTEGKLRDKAVAASAKGKHDTALGYYQQLEALQPEDGAWARKSAEMYRFMGQDSLAIESYTRASLIYGEEGFLVKAVAVCKIILRMDPDNREAQEQLTSFNEARGIHKRVEESDEPQEKKEATAPQQSPPPAPVQAVPPPAPVQAVPLPVLAAPPPIPVDAALEDIDLGQAISPPAPSAAPPPIPVDAALEDIDLGHASIESVQREREGEPSGVTEILLEIEVMEEEAEKGNSALRHIPLFSALSKNSLASLIEKVQLVELAAGETLFREGDLGTTLYVVSEGQVRAVHEGQPEIELATLGDGEFFGEIAIVTNQPRTATVRALVDTELLAIDRQTIGELIAAEPIVLTVLCRFLRTRLVENLVKTSSLFAPFSGEEGTKLVNRFQLLEVEAGSTLIEEGEKAPGLFVVMSGRLDVARKGGMAVAQYLTTLKRGDVFGEMSLLSGTGAAATVRARTKCLILELPAKAFREIIMTHPRVLAYVGDLAAEREQKLSELEHGQTQYEDLHLDLF